MARRALRTKATEFAAEIEGLLNDTVTDGAIVSATELSDEAVLVAPGPPLIGSAVQKTTGLVPCSLDRSEEVRKRSAIWLKIQFQMILDPEREHLTTHSSMFGWCVNSATAYCPLRVEYVRGMIDRQACHVQVDGESAGWAYGMGRLNRPQQPLQRLHLPMGGRRFRPSLEDFIEFLIQERMVPQKRRRWADAVAAGRSGWEQRQTAATVRRNPAAAARELSKHGYVVRKR